MRAKHKPKISNYYKYLQKFKSSYALPLLQKILSILVFVRMKCEGELKKKIDRLKSILTSGLTTQRIMVQSSAYGKRFTYSARVRVSVKLVQANKIA